MVVLGSQSPRKLGLELVLFFKGSSFLFHPKFLMEERLRRVRYIFIIGLMCDWWMIVGFTTRFLHSREDTSLGYVCVNPLLREKHAWSYIHTYMYFKGTFFFERHVKCKLPVQFLGEKHHYFAIKFWWHSILLVGIKERQANVECGLWMHRET